MNNPLLHGIDYEAIIHQLMPSNPVYFCLCTEISPTGTEHYHVFVVFKSQVRFSTLHKRLPTVHLEVASGSSIDNRNYLLKQGKWADTPKADTVVTGSFYEWGTLPANEAAERQPVMFELVEDVKSGLSTVEIINKSPGHALRSKQIDELRQLYLSEHFATTPRDVFVSYLWGGTGTGKTTYVFESHSPQDICRITNYQPNAIFDPYKGESVLFLDEFRSQIPISDLLVYLDRWPVKSLPARYFTRTACYSAVYIVSNIDLWAQYPKVQKDEPETWKALLRRIHKVIHFREDGTTHEKIL